MAQLNKNTSIGDITDVYDRLQNSGGNSIIIDYTITDIDTARDGLLNLIDSVKDGDTYVLIRITDGIDEYNHPAITLDSIPVYDKIIGFIFSPGDTYTNTWFSLQNHSTSSGMYGKGNHLYVYGLCETIEKGQGGLWTINMYGQHPLIMFDTCEILYGSEPLYLGGYGTGDYYDKVIFKDSYFSPTTDTAYVDFGYDVTMGGIEFINTYFNTGNASFSGSKDSNDMVSGYGRRVINSAIITPIWPSFLPDIFLSSVIRIVNPNVTYKNTSTYGPINNIAIYNSLLDVYQLDAKYLFNGSSDRPNKSILIGNTIIYNKSYTTLSGSYASLTTYGNRFIGSKTDQQLS